MIEEYIKEPPKQISGLGAVFEAVMAAGELLLPEVKVVEEIYKTAKTVVETMKPARELVDKANEVVTARSVEEAKSHLRDVAVDAAEEVAHAAPRALRTGLATLGESVEAYLEKNLQPIQTKEDVYRRICDGIGIKDLDPDDSRMKVWRHVMPPFRKEIMRAAASLHFFRELDNDVKRLEFLIEQAEKGNDPEALLEHIGADRKYWGRYLRIYRKDGKEAAYAALMSPWGHTGD